MTSMSNPIRPTTKDYADVNAMGVGKGEIVGKN